MVVDYDPERTAGMTDADMIDAISTIYGPRLKPATPKTPSGRLSNRRGVGTPITRWGDADYSVVLYRSSDVYRLLVSPFRIIVISPRLDSLAGTAEAQALRLNEREAPSEKSRQQEEEADDARASKEKARLTSKAAFRP